MYTHEMELTIGEQLSMARARSGRKQLDVALESGMTASTLSRIELGKVSPTVDQIQAISASLGLSLTLKVAQ